jgi:spore coat protein CotH
MSKHKLTDAVCIAATIAAVFLAAAFMAGGSFGIVAVASQPAYAERLFSTDKVHTIDIVVNKNDWENMLENAGAEEYIECSVAIDGEAVKGVGVRPKGNSSLSSIARSDSNRYSFKVEFDHYETGKTYFGLDKLSLNNVAQDNTYMKDYVSYQLMSAAGAAAPLASFIWVTVNNEDWGLYLAVECVEESFARRVYGAGYGEIYKPDTMDLNRENDWQASGEAPEGIPRSGRRNFENLPEGERPNFENLPEGEPPNFENFPEGERPNFENMPQGGFGGGGRGGNGVTSLIYVDDNPESYAAIFDNAAFDVSSADKTRLINALKIMNSGENIESAVDTEQTIRYFAAHNFVLNSDSYTGNLVHNYYLYEKDGRLSMIPWDYNLAFGGMSGRGMAGASDATSMINYPIDDPLLSGTIDEKPMLAWIFNDEKYLAAYHETMSEFMKYFSSKKFAEMYDNAVELISPYVKNDPSAFCSYEDFEKACGELRKFCVLRAESISLQLEGVIAPTAAGQTDKTNFVDGSGIDIGAMGNMGFNRARGYAP